MRHLALAFAMAASTMAMAQVAQHEPSAAPLDGKALFQEKCVMCHGRVGMGTGLLARRVQPPMLEQRTDLAADYVVAAARTGIGNMPPIPRGEASDAQLGAIAAYLSAKKAPPQ